MFFSFFVFYLFPFLSSLFPLRALTFKHGIKLASHRRFIFGQVGSAKCPVELVLPSKSIPRTFLLWASEPVCLSPLLFWTLESHFFSSPLSVHFLPFFFYSTRSLPFLYFLHLWFLAPVSKTLGHMRSLRCPLGGRRSSSRYCCSCFCSPARVVMATAKMRSFDLFRR